MKPLTMQMLFYKQHFDVDTDLEEEIEFENHSTFLFASMGSERTRPKILLPCFKTEPASSFR